MNTFCKIRVHQFASFAVYADVLELAVLGHVDVVIFANDLVAADISKLLKASCELSTLLSESLFLSAFSFQSFCTSALFLFNRFLSAPLLLLLLCCCCCCVVTDATSSAVVWSYSNANHCSICTSLWLPNVKFVSIWLVGLSSAGVVMHPRSS
jgi:hypothetical protein